MAENFVRDGRVGDEVWHPCYGNGVIDIFYAVNNEKTLFVMFDNCGRLFTPAGRIATDTHEAPYASLCWGHRIAQQINQGKPPVREDSDDQR